MNVKEIESKILELKGKQSAHFSKKKDQRNAAELEAVRTELNDLKKQAGAIYRPSKAKKA